MAARGSKAKENIANKLKELYGDDYLGEKDKKLFVVEDDGNEKVQIAISLTCSKIPFAAGGPDAANGEQSNELSEYDKAKIEELLKKIKGRSV